ncbi:MAG: sugar phosphate isomerase/epimerase family protein [Saccharofermentanales bacterium]
MIIGAQLYTIRDFAKNEAEISESFRKIAQIGYTCVQVSGLGPISAGQLRSISLENNLEIVVTHTDPERIMNDTDNVINEHKILGCNLVGIGYMPGKYHGSLEGYKAFISDFNPAAARIADSGMKLCYHNHAFEFEKIAGEICFDILVDQTDPLLWEFIPDTYWIAFAGRCPTRQLEALEGRVTVCHFKDMMITGGLQRMASVMEGNLDWSDIFDACRKTGIKYAMVEQDDTYGVDPFDALKISYDNLTKAGFM